MIFDCILTFVHDTISSTKHVTTINLQIVDFVDPLVGWLPGLWGVATDHAMLQSQLLTTARKLSRCLGPMSVKLYGFTDPVLKYVLTQVSSRSPCHDLRFVNISV